MKKMKEIIIKKETYFCDFCNEEINTNRICSYCKKHFCLKCGEIYTVEDDFYEIALCNEHVEKYKLYEKEIAPIYDEFKNKKDKLYKQIMEG